MLSWHADAEGFAWLGRQLNLLK